jgi:hypothetical protein
LKKGARVSLNWNLSKVKNHQELTEEMSAVTETLIFFTMFVGVPNVTEKTADTFFKRIQIFEKLFGCIVRTVDEDGKLDYYSIQLSDVERHVGLHTNAVAYTDAQFKNQVFKRINEELDREIERARSRS